MSEADSIRQQELEQKRHYWKTHITSWQASRVSQAEYCRRHELKLHHFVYWRRKFIPKPYVSRVFVQVPTAAVARATGYAAAAALRWPWAGSVHRSFPRL